MASDQRRHNKLTDTAASSSSLTLRSQSAPPRKKWYRRGPSLLSRQRSTRQEADGSAACSMLYDQMVSRRLVGAIAAWHDLHASLLQLSMSRAQEASAVEEDGGGGGGGSAKKKKTSSLAKRRARGCESSGSSFTSSTGITGKERQRREASSSGRRANQQNSTGKRHARGMCRLHHEGAANAISPLAVDRPALTTDACSRSSSPGSGGSSSAGANRSRLLLRDGRSPQGSEEAHRQKALVQLSKSSMASSQASFSTSSDHRPLQRLPEGIVEERAATWSATFSQSLKIRPVPSTRRRSGRSPVMGRARSPARPPPARQIVIKHSVQLLQPGPSTTNNTNNYRHNHHPVANWSASQPAMMPPPLPSSMLSLIGRPGSPRLGAAQRRCFSVAKVDESGRRRRKLQQNASQQPPRLEHQHQQCSCGWSSAEEEEEGESASREEHDEEEDEEEDSNALPGGLAGTGSGSSEADSLPGDDTALDDPLELASSGCSSGTLSDTELDALYEQGRSSNCRQHKLSSSSPELTPEQLKLLFPELSDHWSVLIKVFSSSLCPS